MLVKLSPEVNFINMFRVAFMTQSAVSLIILFTNNTSPNAMKKLTPSLGIPYLGV